MLTQAEWGCFAERQNESPNGVQNLGRKIALVQGWRYFTINAGISAREAEKAVAPFRREVEALKAALKKAPARCNVRQKKARRVA